MEQIKNELISLTVGVFVFESALLCSMSFLV